MFTVLISCLKTQKTYNVVSPRVLSEVSNQKLFLTFFHISIIKEHCRFFKDSVLKSERVYELAQSFTCGDVEDNRHRQYSTAHYILCGNVNPQQIHPVG